MSGVHYPASAASRPQPRYVLSADLPGVDPGSIDIDLDGHLLTIRAERISAAYDNGALSLVIPLMERAKPRKIQIGSPAGDQTSISA